MARMIPSNISPKIRSNAEKRIFEWFRDDMRTADWIVLHSLGISNHNSVIHGETDFFVLVPNMGMFALEVKGGRVSRKNGIWSFTDKYGNTSTKERGPFDQAWEGIFSIANHIKDKLDESHQYLNNILYGIGVMFPDIEYTSVGCDEAQWQVFDCNDGHNVYRFIQRLFEGSKKRWCEIYGASSLENKLPSQSDIEYIAELLRGDFDKVVALNVQISSAEEQLIQLTSEQYRCIDQLDENKRCIIEGGAGTGKTLIALEQVKKAVAEGLRVALICYNKKLSEWFDYYFETVMSEFKPSFMGTFHSLISKIVTQSGKNISKPNYESKLHEYYTEILPKAACEVLSEQGFTKFDIVIIDEAQDLIIERFLDVFDNCIVGGLARGRWIFFGDFSKQAIYNDSFTEQEMKKMIEDRASFIKFRLTLNCRNTQNICDEIQVITDFKTKNHICNNIEGIPVQYITYSSREEEKMKLVETLKFLRNNHISPSKVCILSPFVREKSIVSELTEFIIENYDVRGNNNYSFCTIQSFKGLENTIVILVDIESIANTQLLYVGLSRARSGLYIIESDRARKEYIDIQIRRLSDGYKTQSNN